MSAGGSIAGHLASVQARIEQACQRSGRNLNAVHLLAVSKTRSTDDIAAAAAAGQLAFGENYLDEALSKINALHTPLLEWHYIGSIQSRKAADIARHFDWVHSVDRLKVAKKLSDHRPETLPPLKICIQVNIDHEPSKSGVRSDELPALIDAVRTLPRLQLEGLMCLPVPRHDFDSQREPFRRLAKLAAQAELQTLSMGMSDDLEAAVAEGATWVRVGTAIFGTRKLTQLDV